jgi:hypothetical protein
MNSLLSKEAFLDFRFDINLESFGSCVCRGFEDRALFKSSSRVARRQCDTPVQLHVQRLIRCIYYLPYVPKT